MTLHIPVDPKWLGKINSILECRDLAQAGLSPKQRHKVMQANPFGELALSLIGELAHAIADAQVAAVVPGSGVASDA